MITIESPAPKPPLGLSSLRIEYLHSFNGVPIFLDLDPNTPMPLLVGVRPPITYTGWWIGREEIDANYMDLPEDLLNDLKSLATLMNLF